MGKFRSRENAMVTDETRIDKGYSWVACIMGFVIQCLIAGQNNCSGIIFAALLDEYKTNRGQTAWVTSIAAGTGHAFGMVPAALGIRFGFANVIILGGFICVVGQLSSSFVGNIYLLYLTYGLVWGFGCCLCYCSSLFILPMYFRARLGLANGIAFLGAPVGSLVLSLVIQALVSSLGLQKTFQILAGLQVIVVFCGVAIRCVPSPSDVDHQTLDSDRMKTSFDWSVLRQKDFLTLVGSICVFSPAYLVPYVHLVRLAKDSDVASGKSAFLVSFMAFGSVTARPLFGKLMDHPRVNRVITLQLTLLAISVSMTLLPVATNYEWLATFAFLYGFLEGCFVIAVPLIVQELVGNNRLAPALGSLYCFVSIPEMAGPSIAGWMYDESQSYAVAFFCAGGITIVSTCILFMISSHQTNSSSKRGPRAVVQLVEFGEETIAVRETRL